MFVVFLTFTPLSPSFPHNPPLRALQAVRDVDGDGQLTMDEMSAYQGENTFLLPGGFKPAAQLAAVMSPASGAKSAPQTPPTSGLVQSN